MLNIVRGDLKQKPVSTQRLIYAFESIKDEIEGVLYIGYPIIGTSVGGYQIDALLISPDKGVILFNLIENNISNFEFIDVQDENYTKFSSKLFQHKELLVRRSLGFEISTVTFAPAWTNFENIHPENPCLTSEDELIAYIHNSGQPMKGLYHELLSVVQSITSIRRPKNRDYVKKDESRGAKLKKLEDSIANLDSAQSSAIIETVDGVQRIRGLAGSGKSIILALKVAYLHARNPDWKIAVTFNTRSLKGQFRKFITNFSFAHMGQEPDWSKIEIIHAWGSPKYDGIYYNLCRENNHIYKDFEDSRRISTRYGEEFDLICGEVINSKVNISPKYDLIVVDEAQDFSPDFLRICYKLLLDPKRLVYAYDELQSLNNKSMLSPEEIFGQDIQGRNLVNLKNEDGQPKRDIILYKCYRNPKEILTAAHALGFGIYRESQIVQMFEQSSLWKDIGYDLEEGDFIDNQKIILSRTNQTSPDFLSSHSPQDDLIIFKTFNNNDEQIDFVVSSIIKNIKDDELKLDDILVINPNPLTTRNVVGAFRAKLFEAGINSSLAGVSSSPDVFFDENQITFTGINRAKGNEAGMVYIINADYCYSGLELSKKRNILFTAMTRSKAWLRVCGIGSEMKNLETEYRKVVSAKFKLDFTYPDLETREKIRIVNRDLSEEEKKTISTNKENLKNLAEDIKLGRLKIEDLPEDVIQFFFSQLNNAKKK